MILALALLAAAPNCSDGKPAYENTLLVKRVPLAYPQSVHWNRVVSLDVSIDVRVAPDGSVAFTRISRGSGNAAVDAEALRSAALSSYAPARVACAPAFGTFTFVAEFNPNAEPDDAPATPVPGCNHVDRAASLISSPLLPIPDAARDLGIRSATVVVDVTVDRNGAAADPQIVQSANVSIFDRVALQYAKRLVFAPALSDCVPSRSHYTWQAVFRD